MPPSPAQRGGVPRTLLLHPVLRLLPCSPAAAQGAAASVGPAGPACTGDAAARPPCWVFAIAFRAIAFRATACPICWSGCRLRSARCRLGSRGRHKGLCAITPLTPHPTTPLCDAHPPLICSRWRRRGGRDESGCGQCRTRVSPDGRHLYHRPEEDTWMPSSSVAPEKCRGPRLCDAPVLVHVVAMSPARRSRQNGIAWAGDMLNVTAR